MSFNWNNLKFSMPFYSFCNAQFLRVPSSKNRCWMVAVTEFVCSKWLTIISVKVFCE